MNDTLLFDSMTSPIPGIRQDINIIPIKDDGRDLLYFHDVMGYVSPNFALDNQVETVLSLINNRTSIQEISKLSDGNISTDELLEFIQVLDQNRVLDTKHFKLFSNKIEKQFENKSIRKPALSGQSYPNNPEKLNEFLSSIFTDSSSVDAGNSKALYAPHIDLRVGLKQYAEAFSSLRSVKPKRVVVLATSHYSGYFPNVYQDTPFIGSNKHFELPNRAFKTDLTYLKQLSSVSSGDIGFTLADRAHRIEHSIEIHLLLASHVWQHDFEIVPILIGSLDEILYHKSGDLASKVRNFSKTLRDLDDDETFYLVSGDLSHVGRKFGDKASAKIMKNEITTIDEKFMDASVNGNPMEMLNDLTSHYDSSRICGFPPLYTLLNIFEDLKGEQINYHWWDEERTESAVSFGSILYQKR